MTYASGSFETTETTKYAIESTSGQWWNGSCWGVIQARDEYDSTDDLPEWCGGAQKEEFSTMDMGGVLDIRYYAECEDGGAPADDSIASVREV